VLQCIVLHESPGRFSPQSVHAGQRRGRPQLPPNTECEVEMVMGPTLARLRAQAITRRRVIATWCLISPLFTNLIGIAIPCRESQTRLLTLNFVLIGLVFMIVLLILIPYPLAATAVVHAQPSR